MCLRKSQATPVESKEVTVGMVWIHLDRQSTTMRAALYPLESGSSLIMSMEITCQHQSGTLLGISFPTFCVRKVFVQLHTSHPVMNLAMYLDSLATSSSVTPALVSSNVQGVW